MATRHYVVIIRDEQGDIIDHYDGDPEVHRLRQQVADLRELLDVGFRGGEPASVCAHLREAGMKEGNSIPGMDELPDP